MSYSSLKLTSNRKVKFFNDHRNTFGLYYGKPSKGGTCPGATCGKGGCLGGRRTVGSTTEQCYVANLCKLYPQTKSALQFNTNLLVGLDFTKTVTVLRNTILKWLLNGGYKAQFFRLHWSGDFFDMTYARAWAKIIREYPSVTFWGYTRSFQPPVDVLPILADCPNLALYLSCDDINYEQACAAYKKYEDHTNVALAYMGDSLKKNLAHKFVPCPETQGKIKNLADAGACSRCKLCFANLNQKKLKNIRFKLH